MSQSLNDSIAQWINAPMPFACIYVPNFSVAAALRAEPELKTRAVAIFEGKLPLEKVIAINEKAAHMGIAPGMTKTQAELCAELALRPRSPLQESVAHAAMLDCAQSFSPCVEDSACDTAVLDLAGMESLLGTLPEISLAIHTRAATLGLETKVAIASNPDAAVLAARGLCSCGAGALATVIPEGKEAEELGPLPVEVLFTDHEGADEKKSAARLLETFNRWGIRTLRALASLPQISLSERLGQEGLRLQQLARGAVSRTLVSVEEPMLFEEGIELEHPIVLLEPLAFLLNHLLEQVCARLGSRALSTQELRLTLDLESFASCNQESKIGNQQFLRILRLPLPMLDSKVFLKLLQLDLNAHPPGAPIMKIHLAAEPVRPRPGQAGLFLPPSPEPEKLELTLARIGALVGEQKVGALELLDTHHPEGFRMQRFVAGTPEKSRCKKVPEPDEEKSIVTALRRFRPALRASVVLENSQPVQLSCAKRKEVQGSVLWKAGPWRLSGDWWEREAWSRDEWDIAVQNTAPQNGGEVSFYRLVHDLMEGNWFVEGTYD